MKGFKTIIFNALMGIIALWKIYFPEQEMPGEAEVQAAVDVFWQILSGVTVAGNVLLRFVTKTPIFKRES
jgi:hypothetical protein